MKCQRLMNTTTTQVHATRLAAHLALFTICALSVANARADWVGINSSSANLNAAFVQRT